MADFGASLAGVRRLLPELTITDTSRPSAGDIEAWLIEFTGEVTRRLGDLGPLPAEDRARVEDAARRLVHFAVAATTYDAHFPERAGLTESSYGAVLWDRYTTGLTELDEELDELYPPEDSAVAGAALGRLAGSFPDPAFPDDIAL